MSNVHGPRSSKRRLQISSFQSTVLYGPDTVQEKYHHDQLQGFASVVSQPAVLMFIHLWPNERWSIGETKRRMMARLIPYIKEFK